MNPTPPGGSTGAPVARLGGLAVGATFVVVGVGAIATRTHLRRLAVPPASRRRRDIGATQVVALFVGVVVAMALGFIDDRWQIRARYQLLGQLLLAVIALAGGILYRADRQPLPGPWRRVRGPNFTSRLFRVRLASDALIQPVPVVLTALWIVGMINCINWIDGLDGLSTGVSLIAALTLGVISLTARSPWSRWWRSCARCSPGRWPASCPGTSTRRGCSSARPGVMVVGYVLAVLSIMGTAKVAVALLVLGVPIIDTFWIIIRRMASGTSPFEADRGHLHHRLLDLGLTHRGAVLLIYAIAAVLGLAGLLLSSSGAGPLYAFLGIVIAGGLALYLLTRRTRGPARCRELSRRRRRR